LESEFYTVMDLPKPLNPADRTDFLRKAHAAIRMMPVRGPGAVHRVVRGLQRGYFNPPDIGRGSPGRYA
jgi:hypothetical protein